MSVAPKRSLRFTKMHGAGNDFVVIDLREHDPHLAPVGASTEPPTPEQCRALADRHTGVGCDQILTIEAPLEPGSAASYRIWNADGSPSQQCGNGARCVAAWVLRDSVERDPERCLSSHFLLDSPAGTHPVDVLDLQHYRIGMGRPRFVPDIIPMHAAALDAVDVDACRYTATVEGATLTFGAVSMGNPHAVIDLAELTAQATPATVDIGNVDVAGIGAALQRHPAFPESVNVGFAEVVARDRIQLRVYERGVGETLACGSGACAAAAVLMRRGRVDRAVDVVLPGGTLRIEWPDDDAGIRMSGPAAFVFEAEWWS